MDALHLMIKNLEVLDRGELEILKKRLDLLLVDPSPDEEIFRIWTEEKSKLRAVKWFKDATGMGLREAKEYCDALIKKSEEPIEWVKIDWEMPPGRDCGEMPPGSR